MKNIKWKTINKQEFSTLLQCKTHIHENYLALKVKETKITDTLTRTKYQCYKTSNNKKSNRDTCYAQKTFSSMDDNAEVHLQE